MSLDEIEKLVGGAEGTGEVKLISLGRLSRDQDNNYGEHDAAI